MARWFKRAGIGLAALIVVLLLAGLIVPRLLDRVYYRGPVSDHFDGQHFFNPDDGPGGAPELKGFSPWRFISFALRMHRAPWPDHVPVVQTVPVARIDGTAMRVTWIGHSSVLVQTQGLNILTDPVWSDRASPFAFVGPKRVRAPGVAFDKLPRIDLVLVSHNHYDHLDIPTLKRLWVRDRPMIVLPLGDDVPLRDAAIPSIARDWGQSVAVRRGITVKLERVHHWTSRWGSDRNRALWSGFSVQLPGGNIFFAGDTGLGDGSWVSAAAKDGPYRLALIPIGAFQPRDLMGPSHIGPVEAASIFGRLGAHYGVAVHWGTFQLSSEPFDLPPGLLARALAKDGVAAGRFRALVPGQGWDIPAR